MTRSRNPIPIVPDKLAPDKAIRLGRWPEGFDDGRKEP